METFTRFRFDDVYRNVISIKQLRCFSMLLIVVNCWAVGKYGSVLNIFIICNFEDEFDERKLILFLECANFNSSANMRKKQYTIT